MSRRRRQYPLLCKTGEGGLHHIGVVGGGAAGLELVTRLGDASAGAARRITLIEKGRTHLWKPLLHTIAAGSMDPGGHELNYLAQAHWHHFRYRFGEMIGLDRTKKEVWIAATHDEEGRQITPPRAFRYDTLVIAVGSVTNDFGTPGAAQYAVPLETPEQATALARARLDEGADAIKIFQGAWVSPEIMGWEGSGSIKASRGA